VAAAQAAIVRLMKEAGSMAHAQLVAALATRRRGVERAARH
jgi:hypothetical protein